MGLEPLVHGRDRLRVPLSAQASPNRIIALLFAGVALASTGMFSAITLGAIVAVESAGSRAASGVPAAVGIFGTAIGAIWLGRVMQARGRRGGLVVGWLVAAAGGALAVAGVERDSFALVLAGMLGIGLGNAGSQLARYAAAETVDEQHRGRAVSFVVWAAAVGAVGGPLSLGLVGRAAQSVGLEAGTGGFVLVAAAMLGASVVALVLPPMRLEATPDAAAAPSAPRPHARQDTTGAGDDPAARRRLALAVTALVVSQAAMVAVMAITPVHLTDGHHAYGVVGTVMSGHFVGMFALAPLVGMLVDRIGRSAAVPLGFAVLGAGTAAAAVLPVAHGVALSGPLLVIGLGWCACFVSASAVVASELRSGKVAAAQGQLDALVWIGSATASLAAGGLLAITSYGTVAVVATALALATALVMAAGLRAPAAPRTA